MYKINPKHTIKNCRNYGENYNDFTKYMLRIIRLNKYKGLVFINNIETNVPTYVEIKISEKENLEYLMKSYNSKQSLDILKTNLKKDNQGKYKKIWIMWETLSLKFKDSMPAFFTNLSNLFNRFIFPFVRKLVKYTLDFSKIKMNSW